MTVGVTDALEIRLNTDESRSIIDVESLVGVALRRNPKRAHLLVSTVLAKHVPTVPAVSLAAGELLGLLASAALDGEPSPARARDLGRRFAPLVAVLSEGSGADAETIERAHEALAELRRDIHSAATMRADVVTLGYAETATGLGQLVADFLGSYYLHSTRHSPEGATAFAGFAEEHSHATDHALLPTDPQWLRPGGTVVLVDDELSTGTTVINTITALQTAVPQQHWVVASLIDLRSPADRERFVALAESLDTRISTVSLAAGSIELPTDVLARAAALIDTMPGSRIESGDGVVSMLDCTDLTPVRSARFGTSDPVNARLAADIASRVAVTVPDADDNRGVLVLGSEEFIALPMLTAHELQQAVAPRSVRFSTSTRSPIATLDEADYPIADTIRFRSHDTTSDGFGERFAYNLTRSGRRFGTVVFMPEPGTDLALLTAAGGALEALRAVTDAVVVVLLSSSVSTDGTPA